MSTGGPQFEPQQQAISLDELAAAYAQVMGEKAVGEKTSAITAAEEKGEEKGLAPSAAPEEEGADAIPPEVTCCPISPRSILEAMLFVGNRDGQPLTAARAAELMRDVQPDEIPALVDELNQRYAAGGCPYHVVGEGSGYRLALRRQFRPLRNRFYGRIRQARLSQAAVDVLAIIAYQQPVTGEQVHRLRGKPSNHVLAQLVHRGLLRIERAATKRRTAQYYTTDRFLGLFGLKSLDDLPRSEDLDRQ